MTTIVAEDDGSFSGPALPKTSDIDTPSYAMTVADRSYEWYVIASKRSRRCHRLSEFALIVLSAAIPFAAVIAPKRPVVSAIIGSILVILAGVRAIFHWQENYLRFSQAREAVEAERRLYRVGSAPYTDSETRDAELIRAVTRIEHDEMGHWIQIADGQRTTSTNASA